MAQRRMISLSLVDTDKFIEMPIASRLLYYELSVRADDDGFIASPKKIMRMIGCAESDLEQLVESGYLILFESGVVVITHWKVCNFIKKDRYIPTMYQNELSMLSESNGMYCLKQIADDSALVPNCLQNGSNLVPDCLQDGSGLVPTCLQDGSNLVPQDSIGKYSIDKVSIGKVNSLSSGDDNTAENTKRIMDLFNRLCPSLPKVKTLSDKRVLAIIEAEKHLYGNGFEELFNKVEASDFLTGRSSDWCCGFDWLLKPDNITKILEGTYDNKTSSLKSGKAECGSYGLNIDELEKIV